MRIVIAGAGQAGLEAAAFLRSAGFDGSIRLVGDEPVGPYQRPPLSKAYLSGTAGLPLRAAEFYRSKRIELSLGDPVSEIDRDARRVRLAGGSWLDYDRLVLALGAAPRRLAVPGADLTGVRLLRTVADADALRTDLAEPGRRVVAVGGGFLGMEVAATARELGHSVTVVETADRLLPRAVSTTTAAHLVGVHAERGVRIVTGVGVRALHGDPGRRVRSVELDDGTRLPADVVLVAVGAVPRTDLAAWAGLAVDDGIVVDPAMRTSDPAILAVGDCARPADGVRLESVQNAVDQAHFAVAGMCAVAVPGDYRAVPTFWSAQYGENLQIAGWWAGHDSAVTVGDRARGRFSVLLFGGGQLRIVESVNRPMDHLAARALLEAGQGPTPRRAAAPGYALMDHARSSGMFGRAVIGRAG